MLCEQGNIFPVLSFLTEAHTLARVYRAKYLVACGDSGQEALQLIDQTQRLVDALVSWVLDFQRCVALTVL